MKSCEVCKVVIEDGASFCPRCGRAIAFEAHGSAAGRFHELLTEANVYRVRGDYDLAVDKCSEALELDPKDPEVHMLLGDIYAARGRADEAAKWYQMAVELRPGSAVEDARLDYARQWLTKAQKRDRALASADDPIQAPVAGSKFESMLRYVVIVSGAIVLTLIVVGFLSRPKAPQQVDQVTTEQQSPAPRPQPGISSPTYPLAGQSSSTVGGIPSEFLVRPPSEQQLLSNLATNPAVSRRKLIVEDIKTDPRGQGLTVTFRVPDPPARLSRLEILRDSAVVAAAAFAASADTAAVTIRALVHLPGQYSPKEPHLVLVCDVSRKAGGVEPTQATVGQLGKYFTKVWWGPELTK